MKTLLHNTDFAPRPTTGQRQAIVQPKLTVNAPGDRHEQEADILASRAVGGEKVAVRQQVGAAGGQAAPAGVAAQLGKGGGKTLPTGTRSVMETAFSADFSRVRVHADGGAAQLNQQIGARAFTHGPDIYFGAGQYAPQTQPGQQLLAHELTHTVQQQGSAGGGLLQREEDPSAVQATATPTAAPTPFQPVQEQWQNKTLAPTIYPFRQQMYQRLLELYDPKKEDQQLTDDALYQAVRDTLATSTIPLWAQQTFLEHAGMRYKSAHATALPPWLLIDILNKLRTPKGQKAPDSVLPKPSKSSTVDATAKAYAEANADMLGQLQQQHADGSIPDDAWQYIVRKTDLRLDTTDTDWEKAGYEQVADPFWKKALDQWTHKGTTIWREELMRTNALHTASIVCNELAEVGQRHRGIQLPGGIAANASAMFDKANQPQTGPVTTPNPPPAPFFKQGPSVTAQDLVPGVSVFFLSSEWINKPAEAHEQVRVFAGAEFPVPWTVAEGEQEKKENEGKPKKEQKTKSRSTGRPIIRDGFTDADGWVYHVGAQISRTQTLAPGMAGPVQTQWMHWSHQATIVGADPNRRGQYTTLETTKIGAGFNTRSLSSLQSQFVFVAWQPDGLGGTTTFTPPATP